MLPILTLLGLLGCEQPTHIVEGTVVEVRPHEVVLDHKEIPRFMGPMVMPFTVADPSMLEDLEPGHRVTGSLKVEGMGQRV